MKYVYLMGITFSFSIKIYAQNSALDIFQQYAEAPRDIQEAIDRIYIELDKGKNFFTKDLYQSSSQEAVRDFIQSLDDDTAKMAHEQLLRALEPESGTYLRFLKLFTQKAEKDKTLEVRVGKRLNDLNKLLLARNIPVPTPDRCFVVLPLYFGLQDVMHSSWGLHFEGKSARKVKLDEQTSILYQDDRTQTEIKNQIQKTRTARLMGLGLLGLACLADAISYPQKIRAYLQEKKGNKKNKQVADELISLLEDIKIDPEVRKKFLEIDNYWAEKSKADLVEISRSVIEKVKTEGRATHSSAREYLMDTVNTSDIVETVERLGNSLGEGTFHHETNALRTRLMEWWKEYVFSRDYKVFLANMVQNMPELQLKQINDGISGKTLGEGHVEGLEDAAVKFQEGVVENFRTWLLANKKINKPKDLNQEISIFQDEVRAQRLIRGGPDLLTKGCFFGMTSAIAGVGYKIAVGLNKREIDDFFSVQTRGADSFNRFMVLAALPCFLKVVLHGRKNTRDFLTLRKDKNLFSDDDIKKLRDLGNIAEREAAQISAPKNLTEDRLASEVVDEVTQAARETDHHNRTQGARNTGHCLKSLVPWLNQLGSL